MPVPSQFAVAVVAAAYERLDRDERHSARVVDDEVVVGQIQRAVGVDRERVEDEHAMVGGRARCAERRERGGRSAGEIERCEVNASPVDRGDREHRRGTGGGDDRRVGGGSPTIVVAPVTVNVCVLKSQLAALPAPSQAGGGGVAALSRRVAEKSLLVEAVALCPSTSSLSSLVKPKPYGMSMLAATSNNLRPLAPKLVSMTPLSSSRITSMSLELVGDAGFPADAPMDVRPRESTPIAAKLSDEEFSRMVASPRRRRRSNRAPRPGSRA